MLHKHHIIPRHMGGSDETSNLYECSVEQHAELHLDLYLTYGYKQDWVASQVLSGQMGKEELQMERSRMGGMDARCRTPEANAKRSRTQTGRPNSLSHIQAKVKAAVTQRRISPEQLVDMKQRRAAGETMKSLAESYQVSTQTIWRYIHNKMRWQQ